MKPSLSWIDSRSLRELVHGMTLASSAMTGAPAPSSPRSRSEGSVVSRSDGPTPTPTARTVDVDVSSFVPSEADGPGRMRQLVAWASELAGLEEVFVADADGLVIAQRNADAELVAATSWLVTTWEKVERHLRPSGLGAITVELDHRRWLNVFPCRLAWGRVYLGAVSTDRLAPGAWWALADAIASVARDEEEEMR